MFISQMTLNILIVVLHYLIILLERVRLIGNKAICIVLYEVVNTFILPGTSILKSDFLIGFIALMEYWYKSNVLD